MQGYQIDNDFKAIMKVSYRQLRRLIDIDALLSTAQILLAELAAQPAGLTLRQVIIMRKAITSRIIEINKHKTRIERINATKVNKQRSERDKAHYFDTLSASGVIPELLKQTREYRSERAREDKEQVQQKLAAIVPAIQRQYAEVGFNPRASSAERAEWERLRNIERHAIPGVDLSSQGDDILKRMSEAENERTAEARKIVAEKAGATTLDTDIDKIGSAEDWMKEL